MTRFKQHPRWDVFKIISSTLSFTQVIKTGRGYEGQYNLEESRVGLIHWKDYYYLAIQWRFFFKIKMERSRWDWWKLTLNGQMTKRYDELWLLLCIVATGFPYLRVCHRIALYMPFSFIHALLIKWIIFFLQKLYENKVGILKRKMMF